MSEAEPRPAIDAVIFDMDGVLADSEPLHQHAIRALLAEYGVDWAPDGRDPTVGLTSLESFAVICARPTLPLYPPRLDALYTPRWCCPVLTTFSPARCSSSRKMGAPKWPPKPRGSERPGTAGSLL